MEIGKQKSRMSLDNREKKDQVPSLPKMGGIKFSGRCADVFKVIADLPILGSYGRRILLTESLGVLKFRDNLLDGIVMGK